VLTHNLLFVQGQRRAGRPQGAEVETPQMAHAA
jgi:hypothetical protein